MGQGPQYRALGFHGAGPHGSRRVVVRVLQAVAPTFGLYNWGINAADNYGATVAHGGQMNSDKAKAALKWWLHLRDIAPPESSQSTWSEVAATFAAGRAAQGLVYGENTAWIGTRIPGSPRSSAKSAWRSHASISRRDGRCRIRQGLYRLL